MQMIAWHSMLDLNGTCHCWQSPRQQPRLQWLTTPARRLNPCRAGTILGRRWAQLDHPALLAAALLAPQRVPLAAGTGLAWRQEGFDRLQVAVSGSLVQTVVVAAAAEAGYLISCEVRVEATDPGLRTVRLALPH